MSDEKNSLKDVDDVQDDETSTERMKYPDQGKDVDNVQDDETSTERMNYADQVGAGPGVESVEEGASEEETVRKPIAESEAAKQEGSGQAVESAVGTQSKRFLSCETIFAFALPKAVLKEEIEKGKNVSREIEKSAENEEEQKSAQRSNSVEQPSSKQRFGLPLILLFGFLVVCLGVLQLRSGGEGWMTNEEVIIFEGTDPAISSSEAASEELLNVPLNKQNAPRFTTAQLIELSDSSDPLTLSIVVAEAVRRKDQDFLRQVLALAAHPQYVYRIRVVRAFGDPALYVEEVNEEVLAMLFERLEDDDELVRAFAAKALGVTKDQTALVELRARLEVEESAIVRKLLQKAIETLSGAA